MRKPLTVTFVLLSLIGSAQKYDEVYRVQSYIKRNDKWEIELDKPVKLEIKLQDNDLYILDEADTHLVCYQYEGKSEGVDDDNDKYISKTWLAYDERGKRCKFSIQTYKNIPLIILYTFYNDVYFRYYIKGNLKLAMPKNSAVHKGIKTNT
jgi:hypothetical protein